MHVGMTHITETVTLRACHLDERSYRGPFRARGGPQRASLRPEPRRQAAIQLQG